MRSILDHCPKIEISEKKGRFIDDEYSCLSYVAVLEEGKVSVLDENNMLITILRNGDVYGVSNLFNEKRLPSVLKCEENSRLSLYLKSDVRSVLFSSQELMERYCALLNDKISFLISRLEVVSAASNRERLCKYLLSASSPVFKRKEELASFLFMGRSALFRELKFLESEGCIESGADIKVIDKEKIRSFI